MKSQSFLGSRLILVLSALLVVLASSITAFAQGNTSLRGTVTDPQGNTIAGATVTLTNPGTSTSRTATTNDAGVFAFDLIQSGDYRLEVEAKGFKKGIVTDIQALVARPTTVDVQMELGNVAESVTVAAGAGDILINRDDGTLGNNFVGQQIRQLPLESRNVLGLLTLQPAVTPSGYVAGARSDQSNITLDGVDINEAQTNSINSPVLRLNAEAIEEFRVTTSNANSSAGRSSGAQISLVTKGGTNDFHGALFLSHRNTVTTANDFFNNRIGLKRPVLLRNVFGGAVGGPIIRERTFFFYSYEGRRDASQEPAGAQTVPLASLGRGELRYRNPSGGITTLTTAQLNTIFPSVGINPLAVSALAAAAASYPANDLTIGDGLNTGGFRFNAPRPVENNSHSARFDFNLTGAQKLFARGNYIYDLQGGIPAFPDTPKPNFWNHPYGFVVGHDWTINNSLVNNFRYGLTRQAFSSQGDSSENAVSFRFVFSPLLFSRTLTRTTPVHNFTNDISWITGDHNFQFGTNIRIIRNQRNSFGNAFDTAITNPSFYFGSGTLESNAITAFSPIGAGVSDVQNAVTALIGRFSQYSARFTFGSDGSLLPSGTGAERTFATEEYDVYAQDSWRIRPNLTLNLGLRYGLSRPVYETQGFETTPNIPLSEYFRRRLAAAAAGRPYNELITVNRTGPANGGPPIYPWDKNNFQPRISLAWSPNPKGGWLRSLFGAENQSVIRGGFAITNDYFGNQLAVTFDGLNTLGFTSNTTIAANTYNTTTRPAPLFTGYTQQVRPLPGITVPGQLIFPQQQSARVVSTRIESSLDQELVSPINYSWNVTFERSLPKGMVVQASYIGRAARNLLATRDIMALNNIVDPASGVDWYTAASVLEVLRAAGTPVSAIEQIPYFANLFPAALAANYNAFWGDSIPTNLNQTQLVYYLARNYYGNDWVSAQLDIDNLSNLGPHLFYQPQYGALSAFSTVAYSNYHAGTLSLRQRLGQKLTYDLNYTWSHSMDNASGLQTATTFGSAFILNPIRPDDNYANSDFDIRHILNVNAVYQLPLGKGQPWLSDTNSVVEGILGGWQLSGIFRWNSGLPISTPFDDARWATNWNVQSNTTRVRSFESCPDRGGVSAPNLFGCDRTNIYRSFRNARPGETGERNTLRLPGFWVLDMGLYKSFTMPWSEGHKFQIRWDTFNITNTQHMGLIAGGRSGYGLTLDPARLNRTPPASWANFVSIQGTPRVMQFGFRYEF
ncbi:MAG: TonB-dependent receptor [Acidobacteriota bacterium]|nr:TonB-dependent receptor [Acidobacteriota bacterium]